MEYQKNLQHQRIMRGNRKFTDPDERERVLMTYAGIFKNNIAEFAERNKQVKSIKNYSR